MRKLKAWIGLIVERYFPPLFFLVYNVRLVNVSAETERSELELLADFWKLQCIPGQGIGSQRCPSFYVPASKVYTLRNLDHCL